ncbi:MAG TPA: hypothetical protein VM183_07320 [Burkholderiales bacterium]|nr:hypothetical protein [Burkholderiales bacterium]
MLRFSCTFLGLVCASATLAAPRAESALECGIAADMAVVAHSLAKEQVQRAKADTIMARIYDVSESDRGRELMKEILDAAYVSNAAAGGTTPGQSGQKFAEDLYATCLQSGGDMDPVLGKKL